MNKYIINIQHSILITIAHFIGIISKIYIIPFDLIDLIVD